MTPRPTLLVTLASLLSITLMTSSMAAEHFHENGQYQRISPPVPTQVEPGKIEVVEMFFYACPHCYDLDPKIRQWLKNQPDDVAFGRVPAIVGPTWADQARAYYMAEALGILDSFHNKFFDDIHKNDKQYYNQYSVTRFFVEQGFDEARITALYDSPEITKKASDARVLTVKYGLRGVPAIIVGGQYKTASYYTRNLDQMLEVVDELIDKTRNEAQPQTADQQEPAQ